MRRISFSEDFNTAKNEQWACHPVFLGLILQRVEWRRYLLTGWAYLVESTLLAWSTPVTRPIEDEFWSTCPQRLSQPCVPGPVECSRRTEHAVCALILPCDGHLQTITFFWSSHYNQKWVGHHLSTVWVLSGTQAMRTSLFRSIIEPASWIDGRWSKPSSEGVNKTKYKVRTRFARWAMEPDSHRRRNITKYCFTQEVLLQASAYNSVQFYLPWGFHDAPGPQLVQKLPLGQEFDFRYDIASVSTHTRHQIRYSVSAFR